MLLKFAHGRFHVADLLTTLADIVNIDYCWLLFHVVTWVVRYRVFAMLLQVVEYNFIIVLPFSALAMRFLNQLLMFHTFI